MRDEKKTKEQLIEELVALRGRVAELEKEEAAYRRTETALRESEEKYRLIAENTSDVIFIQDMNLNITYVSPSVTPLFGYSVEEALKLRLKDFMMPDSLRRAMDSFKKNAVSAARGEDVGVPLMVYEYIRKDGSTLWGELKVRFLRDDESRPVGVQGVLRDVTDRMRVEEALAESEKRYRTFVEQSAEGIWRLDFEQPISTNLPVDEQIQASYRYGYLAECNDAMARMYGFSSKEDLVGARLVDLHGGVDNPKNLEEQRALVRAGYRVVDAETEEVDKDGRRKYFLNTAVGMIEDGFLVAIWGTQRDITARREAEEALRESEKKFRQFFENEPTYCYMISPGGVILDANRAALRRLGYKKKELVGSSLGKMYAPESRPRVEALLDRWKKTGKIKDEELVILTKQGERRTVLLSASAVRDKEGQLLHSVSVQRDITERKRIEEQIKASLREKEILLKEIHHRVKNNLQVISSLLSLYSRKITDSQAIEVFRESQDRIRSMALIHEKLYRSDDLSRVDCREFVQSLVRGVFRSYGVGLEDVGLEIVFEDVHFGVDVAVPCGLVINELVSNTLKHAFPPTWESEKKIQIRLESSGDGGYELVFADNGVGFPETLDFRQTESLGLRLIAVLVEDQMKGQIALDTEGGTRFRIRFRV